MAPALGATSRRGGGGGSGAKGGGGGGGRGRGRGRGTGGGGERSTSNAPASAAAAAASPADDAPRSNVKGSKHHDKTKRKGGGGGGGNAPAGSNANQQQRAPSTARPMRAANAVVRKVLIRNIPHTTAQEEILALAEAHSVTKESVWRFVPGKVRGNNRQPTTGRLYLDLKKDAEQARKLIAALNGHVLSESKEGRVALEVEFAPYQKIPREKQRKDAKVGTIDRDPEYLAFLEELNKPKEKLPSAELVADATDPTEVVEKPVAALVKYMNERKVHIRDKGKLKGNNGKLFEKGGTAKRQAKKRDGKPTKEKGKTPKDRRKTKVAAADNTGLSTEAAKPRKARATRSTSNKKEPSSEPVEPGMVRIMALKVSKAASEPSATVTSSAVASSTDPKDKSKKNAPGGAAVGGRGKARGSERPLKEPKPAKSSNGSGEGGIGGEPKNQRRRDSRANSTGGAAGGNVGGKKEGPDKARGERKKKVFVPKEPSNQSG